MDPQGFNYENLDSINITSCCSSVHSEVVNSVMMNDVILRGVFTLSSTEDLKNFRMVCLKWKSVISPYFKKRVRVCFDFDNSGQNKETSFSGKKETLADLKEFFEVQNSMDEPQFDSLKLCNHLPCSTTEFSILLSEGQNFIDDLTLANVTLSAENLAGIEFLECYDLMSLIGGIGNLKTLIVQRDLATIKKTTRFTLSLDQLANIQCIDLERCTIELKNWIMMPEKLYLRHNIFTRNGIFVQNVMINNLVDFKVTQTLVCDCHSIEATQMQLDLIGSEKIRNLNLKGVTLLNCGQSSWNIESLSLCRVPFITENNLKVKRFSISFGEFHINKLPSSVQTLKIGFDVKIIINDNVSPFLPNLQSLSVRDKNCMETLLPRLSLFNNLMELKLERLSLTRKVSIDVNKIPKSVKRVFLTFTGFELMEYGKLTVDTLVLTASDLKFVETVTNSIVPKHIVFNNCNLKPEDRDFIVQKLFNTIP